MLERTHSDSNEARINTFATEGLTFGCSAGPRSYCPWGSVTRVQMAAFLCRAFSDQ